MRHNISTISREQFDENINPSKNLENNEKINPNENENNLIQRRNKNNNINLKEKKNSNGIQRYFGKNLLNYYNNELTNTNINNINEKQKNPFEVKSAFTLINHNNLSQPLLPIEKCVFETYELEQINNPQYCIEYSKEIFSFLKSNEKLNMPIYKNINLNKTEISEKSRKILIDWIISVHAKFNLLPNTLFLTINLIDRIIEKNVAYINSFQLLGTTALHIAAKYEEIYPPEINDYIFISNKAFSKEDVIEMENFILDKLNFDILCISPYVFLDRLYFISRENNIDVYYLSSMFIEFSFLSIEIMKNKQSLITASMFYLALKFIYTKKNKVWNNKLQIHTGYKEHKIKSVIKDFILFFKGNIRDKKNKINSLFIKYNHDKFGNISEKYLGKYK
jgi:cyclin B